MTAPGPTLRTHRRAALTGLAVALALAAVALGPVLADPTRTSGSQNHMDMLGHLWAWWNAGQAPLALYRTDTNFYPFVQNLWVTHGGHADIVLGGLLIWAGVPPWLGWNLVCGGLVGLAALGGFRLGFRLTGGLLPATAAAIALAWAPALLREHAMGRVEELGVGAVALVFVGLLDRQHRGGWSSAVMMTAGVVLTTLLSWELGMILGLAVALWLLGLGTKLGGPRDLAALGRILGPCLAGSLVLLPLVLLFLKDMGAAQAIAAAEVDLAAHQAQLEGFVHQNSTSLARWFLPLGGRSVVVPGVGLLALLGLGRRTSRAPLMATVALALLVLSLGPEASLADGQRLLLPYAGAQQVFPPLTWLYFPERFALVALVPLAGLVALGTARLQNWGARLGERGRQGAGIAAIAMLVGSGATLPAGAGFPTAEATPAVGRSALYQCLGPDRPGAVIAVPLPLYGLDPADGPSTAQRATQGALNVHQQWLRAQQLFHGRPLVNGTSVPHLVPAGFRDHLRDSDLLWGLATASAGRPELAPVSAAEVRRLAAQGVAGVVVHSDRFEGSMVSLGRWLSRGLGPALCQQRDGQVWALEP